MTGTRTEKDILFSNTLVATQRAADDAMVGRKKGDHFVGL